MADNQEKSNRMAIEDLQRQIDELKNKPARPVEEEPKPFIDVAKDGQRLIQELEVGTVKDISSKALMGLLTATQLTDLTDSGISTLHYHYDIKPDISPDTDHSAHGLIATFTTDEAITIGQVCYIITPGRMKKAQANAASTSGVVAICATASIAQYGSGNFLLHGFIRDDTWNWTVGATLYLSDTTAGGITETAPADTDEVVKIIGRALTADIILFNPEQTMIVHA